MTDACTVKMCPVIEVYCFLCPPLYKYYKNGTNRYIKMDLSNYFNNIKNILKDSTQLQESKKDKPDGYLSIYYSFVVLVVY